jgi:hypothetical protein
MKSKASKWLPGIHALLQFIKNELNQIISWRSHHVPPAHNPFLEMK